MSHSPSPKPSARPMSGTTASALVVFALGEHCYALPLVHVKELLRMVAIAPLPDAPRGIVGTVNLRGCVIPVWSLRARLGLSPKEATLTDQIIVVHTRAQIVGLVVDSVLEVLTTDQVEVQTLAADLTGARTTLVAKVDGRSIPILDLEAVAAPAETLSLSTHTLADDAL